MRKFVFTALVVLALTGCASTGQYGSFVEQPTAADQRHIADDAVQQLSELYPPAQTRFELQQPTPDPFGMALVSGLRERGYALLEFNPADHVQSSAAPSEAASTGLPLRYVFDTLADVGSSNLYRLTLLVGNQSITRPYLEENGTFVPAGYWARKE